jgi:hypothetical protein
MNLNTLILNLSYMINHNEVPTKCVLAKKWKLRVGINGMGFGGDISASVITNLITISFRS